MTVIHPDSQRLSDRFHTRGNPKGSPAGPQHKSVCDRPHVLSESRGRKSDPSRHSCCFSINVAPTPKTHSNLVSFPRYKSNYSVLAIYIPRHTVCHKLVTVLHY
ncbi:hypothetical protein NQZ68_013757 [Dissostichus eleginoides]|nr:hypothetical protein NQZ68_013757 [Dissostichus eleginoides]